MDLIGRRETHRQALGESCVRYLYRAAIPRRQYVGVKKVEGPSYASRF